MGQTGWKIHNQPASQHDILHLIRTESHHLQQAVAAVAATAPCTCEASITCPRMLNTEQLHCAQNARLATSKQNPFCRLLVYQSRSSNMMGPSASPSDSDSEKYSAPSPAQVRSMCRSLPSGRQSALSPSTRPPHMRWRKKE